MFCGNKLILFAESTLRKNNIKLDQGIFRIRNKVNSANLKVINTTTITKN